MLLVGSVMNIPCPALCVAAGNNRPRLGESRQTALHRRLELQHLEGSTATTSRAADAEKVVPGLKDIARLCLNQQHCSFVSL